MQDWLNKPTEMEIFGMLYPQRSPVATVYVWPSTTAFDRRQQKSDYGHRIWNSYHSNRLFRSVGHASISINYNEKFIYKGYGPLNEYKDIKFVNPITSFKAMFRSYEQDVKSMQSRPEYEIHLYGLDFERLYNFLISPEGSWSTYNLYTKNCSTFVLKALMVGSRGIRPTMWKRSKRFWGNMIDIVKAFAWLSPNVQASSSQRMYWTRMFMYDSNPVLAMDHIFKTLGGDTPDAVLRYAHFLEKYNCKLGK